MDYLLLRKKIWYYNRRPPQEISKFDPRRFVRISLKTDSKKQARKLALRENFKLEQYWQSLIETGIKHSHGYYKQVVERANALGFIYLTNQQLANAPLDEIIKRVDFLEPNLNSKQHESVMGTVDVPIICLDDALSIFWDLKKDVKLDKSDDQYRKWQNPRKLAMSNLINCVGNKPIQEMTRKDMLTFRDWWIERIGLEGISRSTANKHLVYLKAIIETVCENYKITIDLKHLFNKLLFEDDTQTRPPFSTEHILNVLLNPDNLKGMNDVYKNILYVFAETGVHIDEQVGVQPEDIFLNDPIPHIVIKSRVKDKLKTKYRARVMPLVGFALDAFKKYPNGFADLVGSADSISSAIGKYLRENALLPSEKHSTYSLRHSFQDRLTNLDCPDRIQTDLMGHKFGRTKYGSGATLAHRHEWMKKIQLKPENL